MTSTIAFTLLVFLAYFSGLASARRSYIGGVRSAQAIVVGHVEKFILYDAQTNQPILTLLDGMTVNIVYLNASSFNVVATTIDGAVGSVKFGLNGNGNFKVENKAPYALCGNTQLDFHPCPAMIVGQHTLTATSYSGTKASGFIGPSINVSFRIVNALPTPTPTMVPIANTATVRPTSAPVYQRSCGIPKFETGWQRFTPNYPYNTAEAQSDLVGNDIISTGGFTNGFRSVTNHTYARDISVVDSPWRRMDDMPLLVGVTHAATVVIGMKIYMCGGYSGPPPGPHVSYCFVYDHSIATGSGQWSTFANLANNGSAGSGMIYDAGTNALFYSGGAQRPVLGSREAHDQISTWKFSFINPSAGWVPSASLPYMANHLSYLTVKYQGRERHYFAGGQVGENEASGNVVDAFEFLASNETWVRLASMPYGRGHTTTSTRSFGCGFIMAGGSINSVTNALNRTNDIHYYDIPSNSWTYIGTIPVRLATPKNFVDERDFLYYVDHIQTNRRKLSL